MVCTMLILGEAGWRVHKNSLYYFYNSSVNLNLFQNEKILEKHNYEEVSELSRISLKSWPWYFFKHKREILCFLKLDQQS